MHEEKERPDRNTYKVIAFTSAIKVLKQLDHPLRSIEEAKNVRLCSILCSSILAQALQLKGVGAGIARRIEEEFFRR